MDFLFNPDIWLSLITLILLEVVLGVDNLVFISIVTVHLPEQQRDAARKIGLLCALGTRLLFLWLMFWLAHINQTLFTIVNHPVSISDTVFFVGGSYLLFKGFEELKHLYDVVKIVAPKRKVANFAVVIMQIMLFDIIFSIDSIFTALGVAKHLAVMAAAIIITVLIMLLASKPLCDYVQRSPKIKIIAICFLIFIGIMLVSNGIGYPIPHSYLYVSMAVAILVQVANALCLA